MIVPPDLDTLDAAAKDALILALIERINGLIRENAELKQRVAWLEAKLNELSKPPKTPDNSSVPPSTGRKADREPGGRKRRKGRKGVARALAENPDAVVDCKAEACAHCGHGLAAEGHTLAHEYDHVDIPPVEAHTTRVRLFACRCPGCGRKAWGACRRKAWRRARRLGHGCMPLPLTCTTITPLPMAACRFCCARSGTCTSAKGPSPTP